MSDHPNWKIFDSLGEHEVGNFDCPKCYVTNVCSKCGGVDHSIETILYPETEDVGYEHCCDQCDDHWEL